MDYYQTMGVARDADMATIKKAYRRLVKECHPDIHPENKQAEEQFKQIAEAYAILSDAQKRKQYDQEIAAARQKHRQATDQKETRGRSFDPVDFQREFENLFSFSGQEAQTTDHKNGRSRKVYDQEKNKKNPLDTSALFEKYMGFK